MAVGKNKRLGKKKGAKKKIVDPFSKKEWYDVKAPSSIFSKPAIGKTISTKTIGNKLARDNLMGRVFTVSLGDLKDQGEDDAFRKFKLKVEDVQGMNCYTNFHGLDMATDKLRSLVRKWHSLIEAHVDVKTTDGYVLRLFCIGFTKRRPDQSASRKTAYAQTAQVKVLRKKMIEIMRREASSVDLEELVKKFIPETIGREIEKASQSVYPLHNVYIRKVKTIRAPKVDIQKLMELHGSGSKDKGKSVSRD